MTAASSSTLAPHELDRRHRLLVLGICCMSLFVVGIDVTGVNLALPSINKDLGASFSQLQWVVDAYLLVLASLLMLSGSVADRVGRRRTFQVGLLLFGLGSALCSLSTGPAMLISARGLQAIGGSMLNPVAMSIITNTFHNVRERAQAIGVWGGTIGLSMAMGPVVGGALVDAVGWRSIFWLNVPIVLLAALLAARFIPESKAAHARRFDPIGQLLVIVLLATLTYGIIEGRASGWGSPVIVACFVAAVLSLAALGWYEPRCREPLLEVRFFRSVPFSGSVVSAVLGFSAMGGFLFLNTLYLQDSRGFSPFRAGLLTLPMAVMTAVCAPISGRIVGARGPRVPMLVAGAGIIGSAVILTQLSNTTSLWVLGLAYFLFGLGFGMLNAPITNTAVSGMPRSQAGTASAIASTSRQVGSSLGVAIFGAMVFARMQGPATSGLAQASHVGWVVMGLSGVGLLIMALVTTGRWAARSEESVRHYLVDEPAPAIPARSGGS
ncbi:MFS transporter [Leekyejoonella antrihumi]|uniref:MFS transporter n=1 Tax=Leekyejoonella antrihumi TaxID=1660198 RepID=A0A563E5K3_9MICO|nr:MFS transporter [Leekyejoonella antrihumi]TWP37144.1 MFS transporter [Leekyejoonella antrihumi]